MSWVISAVGVVVIAVALRDVFHTLWHPTGRGSVNRLMTTSIWRIARRFDGRSRTTVLVGPFTMLAVVGMWITLVVLGWALVYGPHLPDGFQFDTGLEPDRRAAPLDALYLSLVTVATLGFGDIVPTTHWLRIAVPLQAMVGFGLLTAAVSWVLQVYPALRRRRALAIRLALLRRADVAHHIHELDATVAARLLEDLAGEVVGVRLDLTEYSTVYYFRDEDPATSLAAMSGYAAALAELGSSSAFPEVRLAGTVLACALDDLAGVLDTRFLQVAGTTTDVLAAFAADHGFPPAGR
jgi:hypothetical protein